ncbi:site-specific integrase [Geobacter sp. FeAm09]|uniref:tyrosine-type recombinase/integrase n=1 Tax=Geobacter sp. FeAm09 TaxID=2597769 RepID=UPI001F0F0657|nr:site-specific integrase [Geobacter sp. FeAm09]
MKFTDKFILNLKPTDKIQDIREGKGFGIRVTPGGVKTWFFLYRFDGRRRFMNLGHYPSVSIAEANKRYRDAYSLFEQGKDPLALADCEREERRKAPTVSELVTDYIEKHAKKFKRSWAKDEAILNRDVIPAWGKRKAADIVKRDVIALLDSIIDRDAPGMANNCFQIIRKMFNWAVEKDILTTTPCLGAKLPAPKNIKDRALSDDEIRTLWKSLERDDLCMSLESRRALKLILVTAQRPGEVIGMHTDEIDGQWWIIPKERAKNGRAHRVYLTKTALELIGPLEAMNEKEGKMEPMGYIFPSPVKKSGNKPMGDTALAVTVGKNLTHPLADDKGNQLFNKDGSPATENRLGVAKFTPHDLRRTANTLMAASKIIKEHRERVLNHTLERLDGTYNLHDYDEEKQMALEALERRLKIILAGEKVVDLGTERAKRKLA